MAAKLRKREEIPAQYKWDLSHIYPDDAAWEAALADVLASSKKFAAWEGKVAENPRQAIREYFDLNQQAEPVFSYAFLRGETDNGDPVAQGLRARASQMGVQLSTAMSFFEPELLSLDDALLAEIAADPAMADYDAFLRNLIRQKPHTLPAEQEKLLAMMGQVAQAPNHIFGMLTDVDMSFPPVQMPDGTTAELTEGTYSQFIRSEDREVRKSAFDGIMNTYGSFGSTIAATYNGSVQNDVFQARARHYATARDARMEPLEIPTSVYDNLISEVHAAIPVLNEYLALRKALMGLDELHMYDLYTPMVKDFHMELSYDKAFDLVLEGLKPMGEDYLAKLREARVGGWIDVYPSKGKSSAEPQRQFVGHVHHRARAGALHALLLLQHQPARAQERLQPVRGGSCVHLQRGDDDAPPAQDVRGRQEGAGVPAEPLSGAVPHDRVPSDDVRGV